MKTLSTEEIVTLLVGKVHPVGETTEDNERFENLKELINLTDNLLLKIEEIAEMKNYTEFSIKRAGVQAYRYRLGLTEYKS